MRNVVAVPNQKRHTHKILAILLGIIFVLMTAVLVIFSVNTLSLKVEDVQEVYGTITDVRKRQSAYILTMEGEEYRLLPVVAGEADEDLIQAIIGQSATLYIYPQGEDGDILGFSTSVYSIEKEQGVKLLKDNAVIGCCIFGVITIISLAFEIFYLVKFLKEKDIVRGDVFKLMNTRQLIISQPRQHYLKLSMLPLIFALVFMVPMCIYSETESALFYVFLGLFLGCVLGCIILMLSFLPVIRKKEIEMADKALETLSSEENFNAEHNNIVMDVGNLLAYTVEENGLRYREENEVDFIVNAIKNDLPEGEGIEEYRAMIREGIRERKNSPPEQSKKARRKADVNYAEGSTLVEETFLPYEELNLTTKVCFRHANDLMDIFICSNLKEEQFPTLKNDIFLELTYDLYHYIKKYNIKVEGLDYCLENRKTLMEKYCKCFSSGKEFVYVEFSDDGEEQLFKENKEKIKNKKNLK